MLHRTVLAFMQQDPPPPTPSDMATKLTAQGQGQPFTCVPTLRAHFRHVCSVHTAADTTDKQDACHKLLKAGKIFAKREPAARTFQIWGLVRTQVQQQKHGHTGEKQTGPVLR